MSNRKNHIRKERGAILLMMTIFAVPLMLLLMLAVDGFILQIVDLQVENNTEFAAEAAAIQLWIDPIERNEDGCDSATIPACRFSDALFIANQIFKSPINTPMGQKIEPNDLVEGETFQTGCWSQAQGFTPDNNAANQSSDPVCTDGVNYKATMVYAPNDGQSRFGSYFVQFIGLTGFNTSARAVAYLRTPQGPPGSPGLIIVQRLD